MPKINQKSYSQGTRPQAERMHAIIRRIHKGDYPSRNDLGRELEVNIRTIQRDITFMQNRENLPIKFDPFRRGYYLTEKIKDFPLLQITEGEIVALFVAQRVLAQYRGTPFEQPLRIACEKLVEGLQGELSVAWGDLDAAISFRNIETNPVDISIFKDLSFAVRNCREVTFDYCKLQSEIFESRQLKPYHLTCVNYQWYVIGYDMLRKQVQRFVPSRMQTLRVLNTTFVRPEDFSVDKFLKGSFGVYSGGKPIEIRIWFDSFAARLVQERMWHHSQKVHQLPNNEIELTLTLTSTVEIIPWILNWGVHSKALSPKELTVEIAKSLHGTIKHYT